MGDKSNRSLFLILTIGGVFLSVYLSSCQNDEIPVEWKELRLEDELIDYISFDNDIRRRRVYSFNGVLIAREIITDETSFVLTNCNGYHFGEHLYSEHFKPFFKSPCDFYKEIPDPGETCDSELLNSYMGAEFNIHLTDCDWQCMREYCESLGCKPKDKFEVEYQRNASIIWELSSDEYLETAGLMITNPLRYESSKPLFDKVRNSQIELQELYSQANGTTLNLSVVELMNSVSEFKNSLIETEAILDPSYDLTKRIQSQLEKIEALSQKELLSTQEAYLLKSEIDFGALLVFRALQD